MLRVIDREGRVLRSLSRVQAAFGTRLSPGDFSDFMVRNLGRISIDQTSTRFEIKVRPNRVGDAPLLASVNTPRASRADAFHVVSWTDRWSHSSYGTAQAAVTSLMALVDHEHPLTAAVDAGCRSGRIECLRALMHVRGHHGRHALHYDHDLDASSRPATVAYPSGFHVGYAYNAWGYQTELIDQATSQPLWVANARDAELKLTQQTHGNGVTTIQTFDALTGRLTAITAGGGAAVQNNTIGYDSLGRVTSRNDAIAGLSETFGYDSLSRMTSATVAMSPAPLANAVTYSPVGNILSKTDVGSYSYPAAGQPRLYAVTATNGAVTTTFAAACPRGGVSRARGTPRAT